MLYIKWIKKEYLDSSPRPKKATSNNLSVLGYDNVKSTPINPKIRQELEYLDRDVGKFRIFHLKKKYFEHFI